ncbi:hypothetical protein MNEG_3270 [Monoraphidium neglectum]|jgi:hypothetical protein|uniref:Uncharacterized protein n=1 Tax=Monoraphidium neglectum TaxID=145388 RepID=A0A0D2K2B4_9CHLO|nr:hypothetical protein MNEG_3270 [Monoraphidium neglectum]KIZ04683.1 hypothetical protein MNEG_3270 [Monoraphidium neglectum]|eukprot:XP_013903702.1 hypothetical protein MNEG_3270 [Monoraphidium neglectum]
MIVTHPTLVDASPPKVAPLQWPVHVYRRVLDRALSQDLVSDRELRQAKEAAAAETARLGRPASFSTRRLMRTLTDGNSERAELTPLAEAADEAVAADAAVSSQAGAGQQAGEGTTGGPTLPATAPVAAPDGSLLAAPSASGSTAAAAVQGAATIGSFVDLSELDEFETILHDLHLILPGDPDSP